ncbi:MAG: peptide chain release factor N(5)-glutamine methyltransferase [Mycobacteriales bacterium]
MTPLVSGPPLRNALRAATSHLSVAGVASPRTDAELLAAFVLGMSRVQLLRGALLGDVGFTPQQRDRFTDLIAQRAKRVPLQHLTGVAPFRRLELAVGPGVFVPRPETELLAGWGIERLEFLQRIAPAQVVDLCAGSGAIAFAIVMETANVDVHAVELESEALVWLQRNLVDCCELADGSGVRMVAGDATAADTLAQLDGYVDLVLSNPPYIDRAEHVAPEAKLYDPPSALWADEDGLSVIASVAVRAAALLRPGGWFGVEHGETHGERVRELLVEKDWQCVNTHPDLTRRDRFTTAQRV